MPIICDIIIFVYAVFMLLYFGIKKIYSVLMVPDPGKRRKQKKQKIYFSPGGDYYLFYYDIIKSNSHVLIAGATGSGKSVIINGIIETIIKLFPPGSVDGSGIDFILCDPKKVELSRYKDLPHVIEYADTLPGITAALKTGRNIMQSRFDEMKKAGKVLTDKGPLFIIIDEYADFILDKSEVTNQNKNILYSIGRLGRAAKVFLIVATQTPNRDVITKMIDANFSYRIGLHCNKDIESRQIIGFNYCVTLPKYGNCYRVEPGNIPELMLNVPMYSDLEIKNTIDQYKRENQEKLCNHYNQLNGTNYKI